MANRMKGEVEWVVGDDTYILHYSFDTLVTLETKLGMGFPVIARTLADPDKITLGIVRTIVHVGLQKNHPKITLTDAGDLIAASGGVLNTLKVVDGAMSASFGDEPANPPMGAAEPSKTNGIGLAS